MEPPRDDPRSEDATRVSQTIGGPTAPTGTGSTTGPGGTTPEGPGGPGGPGVIVNWPAGARLPLPGNAEWAMWAGVEILFMLIWAFSDAVDAGGFVTATAAITFAYLISRGIAKASRVLEQ